MKSMMKTDDMKEKEECAIACEPSKYPYGLCISLDHESIEKLGLKDLPEVGSKMSMMALVEVQSISSSDYKGSGKHMNMSLQITDMELGSAKKGKKAEDMLYAKDDE